MSAISKYEQRAQSVGSLLCVGLDGEISRMPERFRNEPEPQFAFNRWLIEQTHTYVSAYKPNIAFYEARGDQGLRELKHTIEYLHSHYPDIYTICDAKRADIGNTNQGYVEGVFDWLGCDSITLHPYLGREALAPFLERADKGCIILCRTSNPGAGELQDLMVGERPLWQVVAEQVRDHWNGNGNCMLVVGAIYPDELRQVRALVGEMPLLVPGVGAQGGDLAAAVAAGITSSGGGLMLSVSRSVMYADNPGAEAQRLRDAIRQVQS